jgi:hypothetical protein
MNSAGRSTIIGETIREGKRNNLANLSHGRNVTEEGYVTLPTSQRWKLTFSEGNWRRLKRLYQSSAYISTCLVILYIPHRRESEIIFPFHLLQSHWIIFSIFKLRINLWNLWMHTTTDRIIMSLNVQHLCTVTVIYQKEIYILAWSASYKHATSPWRATIAHSVQGLTKDLIAEETEFNSRQQEEEISLFSTLSRLALGPTQRPVHEADHSPTSSAEVKNGGIWKCDSVF